MTRKEVCKATGISVKTLRLYEEKGLIAPARDWRNGREYRVYTPELVTQLRQIVVLRRALFTMDEIKTMQEHPEKIPEIFRDYQQWLVQQERQFQLLRQAAERLDIDTLGSIDGLLTGLQGAAESMPLPAMDVKPNFKRLDALEEPPRHVDTQVNFDETVPDARVFRQMNLVMDRDKTNNINIAFGQYNDLRREFSRQEPSGVVQRVRQRPRWLRICFGILTALTIACVPVGWITRSAVAGTLFWGLLALRLVLEGLVLWREHRVWLKSAQQTDYDRQQKRAPMDFGGYARERRRRIKIAALGVAGGLVVIGLIVLLCRVIYVQEHPDTDYRVCFASIANVYQEDLTAMEHTLAPLVGDLDGNGKEVVAVDLLQVRPDLWYTTEIGDLSAPDYLKHSAKQGQYVLYFITDIQYNGYHIGRDFRFQQYCRELPEDLADPSNPCRTDLSGTAVFEAAGLEALPVYGCIPQAATQEEYDFAVALLREILAQ